MVSPVIISIQILDDNVSFGPTAGNYYTFDNTNKRLLEVQSNGTLVNSFIVTGNLVRNTVKALKYDGTHFWTLEDLPSDLGIVIKKWRLFPFPTKFFPNVVPSEFRWQDELTLDHDADIRWESNAFCVEHYHRTLSSVGVIGSFSIDVNDSSRMTVGMILYLGPSAATGSIGKEEIIVITNIVGNTISFNKSGGLENGYLGSEPVDFVKSIYIFNDHSSGGTANNGGSLRKFSYPGKTSLFVIKGRRYGLVSAADFDSDRLCFVRGDQIVQVDIDDPEFDVLSSMESNLRESDKVTPIEVFDLIADLSNSRFLKLQRKSTSEETGVTQIFASNKHSLEQMLTASFVNSVALFFTDRFIIRAPSGETASATAEVRDQYNTPLSSQTIQFSATVNAAFTGSPGTFSPLQVITNTAGQSTSTYTPSNTNTELLMDIKAIKVGGTKLQEEVIAVIVQKADVTTNQSQLNPSTSRPIEQTRVEIQKIFNNIQQFILRTASSGPVEFSRPIQQRAGATFSITPPVLNRDSIIQLIKVATNGSIGFPAYNGPLQQFRFLETLKPQQFIIRTDATASRPIQLLTVITNNTSLTQFDFIIVITPICGSIKNPVNTNIRWRVKDSGIPFNVETLVFTVNGIAVQDTSSFSVVGFAGGIEINYNPSEDFEYDSEVQIVFRIEDNDDPPNVFISTCIWFTTADTKRPVFSNVLPICNSVGVSSTANIEFDVIDVGKGIDPNSIVIAVEGINVCSGIALEEITTLASGSGYHVTYTHLQEPFTYGSEVTMFFQASDLADPPNTNSFICCFTVEESNEPIFINMSPEVCQTFVDTETGLTFEVYGVEHGVDISTLEVRVDNELRKVYVYPRILRIQ